VKGSVGLTLALLVVLVTACQGQKGREGVERRSGGEAREERIMQKIELSSPAFSHGDFIPAKHTCDGQDVSPELNWSGVPEGTRSLALICDDPDAPVGTWVHWVLFNIPPDLKGLPEAVPALERVLDTAVHGVNDFGRLGYGGPCPPRGSAHRYFFRLYALDTKLDLPPGASKRQVLAAAEGHVLAQGELMGRYQRK